MSSGARIDQFFASKKRKPQSPGFKHGGNKKGMETVVQGSPSAKGKLDSFLVTSQDDNVTANPLYSAHSLMARQDPVKRNLELEISTSLEDGDKHPFMSTHVHSKSSETLDTSQEGASKGSSDIAAAGPTSCVVYGHGAQNSELRQFANDFLSLYCSELQTTTSKLPEPEESDHKRHGSPSLLAQEDKATKKRHCIANQSTLDSETVCSIEKKPVEVQTKPVLRNGESVFYSSELHVGDKPTEPQASLRKCSQPSNSWECHTPCSYAIQARTRETPKSIHGSSIFSPGEAFWNEAIQLADGLCIPADKFSAKAAKESSHGESHYDMQNVLSSRNCDDKPKDLLDEGCSRVGHMNMGASLWLLEKHKQDLDVEVSPFPVKHFDFSHEGKNSEDRNQNHSAVDDLTHIEDKVKQLQYGSASHASTKTQCCKSQINTDLSEEQGMTSVHAVTKKKIQLNQDNHNITSSSPVNGLRNNAGNLENSEPGTPSSFVALKDRLELYSWLPPEICNAYRKKGISKLYPWQVDCLQVNGVLQRRNLVYCASTSAGKSFVAEILMLRRVISTGKSALLVLPYVSICTEKAEHLEALLEPLGKQVCSYYGSQGGGTLPKETSVAVCTIEKANSLVNRLLEEGRLSEIGIVVIDELHMVGDQNRGYLLELMLTKLRYAAGEGNSEQSSGESSGLSSGKADPAHGLQIVGMSATMPNVAAVADWLQAALYETDFRPVPLEEYIKVGSAIYNKEMDIVRTIPKAAELGGKDPDHIVELCNEVVQEGHSVLVFCSSRKGCESTARHISKFLKKFSVDVRNDNCQFVDVTSAIDALRRCPAGLDPILEETFYSGVAYHHAGLTVEEREIVESCYRGGLLRVLTATSTLAAGVNLPARRVIFRQPRIGRDFIDGTRYKQMAGRAGRTGIDTKGESVLICKPEDVKRITGLLNDNCPPLHSCLCEDLNGMTHAILEVVAGGIVQTSNDINRYVRCTLLNSTKPFQAVVKSAQDSLRWLCHRKFLEWNEDTKLYSTTPLGRAAFGSSLCPEESLIVLDDLSRAREGFVLASDLHLVYLVTPINVDVEPDWELFYERFMQLSALDQSVGNRVGVAEPFLMRMAHGAPIRTSNKSKDSIKGLHGKFKIQPGITKSNVLSDEETLRVCKRFHVALILSRLVQEVPVAEVCETFKVARGMVQALQENAGRFASMVSVFCERLGWHDLEGLVAKFQNRVSFGVRAEVVELTTIPYVKGSRARALYKSGLRSPLAIAEASIPEIVKALFESSSWATDDYVAVEGSALRRFQIGIAKKIKNGARRIVLDKAEEARVAAFTAFKSLGYSVPQFSRPVLLTASKKPIIQVDPAIIPFEEGISTRYGNAEHIEHMLSTPSKTCIEEKDNVDKHASAIIPFEESISTRHGNAEQIKHMLSTPSKTCMEENDNVDKHASESQIENKDKVAGNGVVVSVEVSSTGAMGYPAVPQDVSVVAGNKLDDASVQLGTSYQLKTTGGHSYFGKQGQHMIPDLCPGGMVSTCEKGPITSISTPGGFDSFLDLWSSMQEFYFDIHYNKRAELNCAAPYEIHGIAICWESSPVYYVTLPKDLMWVDKKRTELLPVNESCDTSYTSSPDHRLEMLKHRWKRITEIMGKTSVRKFTWNLKIQIQVLKSAVVSVQRLGCSGFAKEHMGLELIDSSYLLLTPVHISNGLDLCIMVWILWPDEERSSNPNLEKEVKKRLSSEAAAAANRNGRWKNQTRRAAHNGCCRRVAQIRALCSHLWKLLISEALIEPLLTIEIPLVSILADMELWGVGVDMEGCIQARNLLVKKLKNLEMEAYKLAGVKFSLYTAADIANVLYVRLKLPIPEGLKKGKQHPSTDKHCLDLLRHEHPIIPVIKEHRTLAKLLNCTLGSICSFARLSMETQKHTLHGRWLQTSTATGRLSMEEPNLQCVEHMVELKMNKDGNVGEADGDYYKVNARDFFVPTQDNWLLLTADYSQIELRLMAHFSRDSSLIELLRNPLSDVFTMIAAKWTRKPLDSVSSDEREQTKRLVYGILYGMGANTLAEQLDCSSNEAKEKIKSFKSSFPGIVSWLHGAVALCHQKGYIKTIKGRKRFLSKIQFGNSKEQSKAQRQAVNSICQGSAADIIKIAMINIYTVIVEGSERPGSDISFSMLKGHCRILLQVHDELIMEVDPSVIKEAALLLQTSMESAASLLVPLHVKLKVGRTWGSLKPFEADQYKDILVSDS